MRWQAPYATTAFLAPSQQTQLFRAQRVPQVCLQPQPLGRAQSVRPEGTRMRRGKPTVLIALLVNTVESPMSPRAASSA